MDKKSDTPKYKNKDIFVSLASLEDIEIEKKILYPVYDINKFTAELKAEKISHNKKIKEVFLQCLKPFSNITINFSDMEYTGLLYEDLDYHVLLASYYNIQYLLAPKKPINEFLHFSIEELSDIPIENDKKRILRDIKRKQDQWYLPLLNFTDTKQLKDISCFLPLIFKFFEYGTSSPNQRNVLNNYHHAITNNSSSYVSSLNRKLKETIHLICAPYQFIFETIFSSPKNADEKKNDFFLYYYKLEQGYGLDLLYDSLEFISHEYKGIQQSDERFTSTKQEIVSFFLLLQKLPNVMTRNLLIKSYYSMFKKCPGLLALLSDFYTLFEKVFLLTIIELFDRDLFAVRDLLSCQLDNLLIPGQLYSAYARKYAPTMKKGAAGNGLSDLPVMHDINAAPDNGMDFSCYGTRNTFSMEWFFNPIQPYNIIVDSYFKERYVPAWWKWTFDDEDFYANLIKYNPVPQ